MHSHRHARRRLYRVAQRHTRVEFLDLQLKRSASQRRELQQRFNEGVDLLASRVCFLKLAAPLHRGQRRRCRSPVREVAREYRERSTQFLRHVGEKLLLRESSPHDGDILPFQLCTCLRERRIRATQLVTPCRLFSGGSHLVGDDAQQRPRIAGERLGVAKIKTHRAEHVVGRLKRQRDDGAKPELTSHVVPVTEVGVGKDVGNLDHPAFTRSLAAGPESHAHPNFAKPRAILLGPVMGRDQPHHLRRTVREVHRGERSTDHRTDPVEGELEDVLGPVGANERMRDLTDRRQLPLPQRFGGGRRERRVDAGGVTAAGHEGKSTVRPSPLSTCAPSTRPAISA